jgi:hypothetical protein
MSPIENHVDWTVAATPDSEGVVPSLSRPTKQPSPAPSKRSVVDTLLGEHNLAAYDSSGNDPYNATGRRFRR